MARGDQPVAAVVSLAAHHAGRAGAGDVPRRLGDARARGLHQLERGDALLVDSP